MKIFLVGGAVRDHYFGRPTKDFDFAVEAESYESMVGYLSRRGLDVKLERPEFVTVRGLVKRSFLGDFGHTLPRTLSPDSIIPADFTLCREEAMYSDQRHPDKVTPAPLLVDLARRDFTMNAIAVSELGAVIDPHEGRHDIDFRLLKTVGSAADRFREDPLRMLRALRFMVMYNMRPSLDIHRLLDDEEFTDLIQTLPVERVREELHRLLSHDWYETMQRLFLDHPMLAASINEKFPNLWLKPTTESR